MAAAISVYIAALQNHKRAPGEVGYVLLLAASRSQASVAFDYVVGFLQSSPILKQQINSVTASELRLAGGIIIGVHAGSYRTIRGRTLLGIVGDETSFWRDENSAQPDVEIYRAVMPSLAASGGMWIGISTGYKRSGLLYDKWKQHFGQNSDDVLVIQGPTAAFNRTINAKVIARASAADPEAAASEWLGDFRSDLAQFLAEEIIDACVDTARPLELPPRSGITYTAFVDPSGGRGDSFTIVIGHREGTGSGSFFVADAIRGVPPPFDPQHVVDQYVKLMRDYRVDRCGDNYSAEWVAQSFQPLRRPKWIRRFGPEPEVPSDVAYLAGVILLFD